VTSDINQDTTALYLALNGYISDSTYWQ